MIVLDISPAVHRRAGIGRMAGELFRALQKTPWAELIVPFYNRAAEIGTVGRNSWSPKTLTLNWGDRRWRATVMAATLLGRSQAALFPGAALFHATDHLLPYMPERPAVFTLHDLTPFSHRETHTTLNRFFSRLMWPHFLRQAAFIACDSNHTRQALLARFPEVGADKSAVVHLGIEGRFRPVTEPSERQRVRDTYRLPERFALFVGTIEPRKNIPALLEAFHRAAVPELRLVVAGKRGWRSGPVDEMVARHQLHDRVLFPGFVAEEDLPALYSLAECFVFPTLYEGFGFPVLEAMACGTPVICSNVSSLPEITGEAAVLVDPSDRQQLVEALVTLASSPAERADLAVRGLEQAQKFSWAATAQTMGEIYQRVLTSGRKAN